MSIVVFTVMTAKAKTGHAIVAFDSKPYAGYRSAYQDPKTLSMVDGLIQKDLEFDTLYLSVVSYTMDMANPDIDEYVLPYRSTKGKEIVWERYTSLRELFPQWPQGEPMAHYSGYSMPGSMQSLAKPFSVMETATQSPQHVADATYLFLVTDGKNQGVDDDYAGEWGKMWYFNPAKADRIKDGVFSRLKKFNQTYRFELRGSKSIDGNYAILAYEVLPAEQPSIYSVSNMPTPLPIKRVRGGYKIDDNVKSTNPSYTIIDWKVFGPDGEAFERDKDGDIFIKSGKLKEGDSIEIAMDLRQTDDIYGAALLNKGNCAGMSLRQAIKLSDHHKIWGLVPLSDNFWFWKHNDVDGAVKIWEYIILVAFVVILYCIFRTLSKLMRRYTPSNQKISMNIKTSK